MTRLAERRSVVGGLLVFAGALLVLALNVLSGRAVEGAATAGPPPPAPEVGACVLNYQVGSWREVPCSASHNGEVVKAINGIDIPSGTTISTAQRRELSTRRAQLAAGCGAPATGLPATPLAPWPTSPGNAPGGGRWIPPPVTTGSVIATSAGDAGWAACVQVPQRAYPGSGLVTYSGKLEEITSVRELPVDLRFCAQVDTASAFAPPPSAAGPVDVQPTLVSFGQVDNVTNVPCSEPHNWELLAATADYRMPAQSCRELAVAMIGSAAPLRGWDALSVGSLPDNRMSYLQVKDPETGLLVYRPAPSCAVAAPPERLLTASVVGLGGRPVPLQLDR